MKSNLGKHILRFWTACLLIGVVFAPFSFAGRPEVIEGEYIISFKKGYSVKSLDKMSFIKGELNTQVESLGGDHRMALIKVPSEKKSFIKLLSQAEGIEYIEPNFVYKISAVGKPSVLSNINKMHVLAGTDPLESVQWGLKNTGTNEPGKDFSPNGKKNIAGVDIAVGSVWHEKIVTSDFIVAVIDTGVDYHHPELKDQMYVNTLERDGLPGVDDDGNGFTDDIYGFDFANNDSDPFDDQGHGTHCAGVIAATHQNGEGIKGVMDGAKIMALKFLDADGSGSSWGAIKSIYYAVDAGATVLSNSWGGGGYSQTLKKAIEYAQDNGVWFIAAAGNDATDNDAIAQYPANYTLENVISVAAHSPSDYLAASRNGVFSNYGQKSVHLSAPGQNIISTLPAPLGYGVWSGTSMATPFVSGAIALWMAKYHPSSGPILGASDFTQIKMELMQSTTYSKQMLGTSYSHGRLNLSHFLAKVETPRPAPLSVSDWKTHSLSQVVETPHPYEAYQQYNFELDEVNADHMRIKIEKLSTHEGDVVEFFEGNESVPFYRVSGDLGKFWLPPIKTSKIRVSFKTSYLDSYYGFKISEIRYR